MSERPRGEVLVELLRPGTGGESLDQVSRPALIAVDLAFRGALDEAALALDAARQAAPSSASAVAPLTLGLAEAAVSIAAEDEDAAAQQLAALVGAFPVGSMPGIRLWRLFLALPYVLLPSTRPAIDALPLSGYHDRVRTLAHALVAARDGRAVADAVWTFPWRASVPDRWAAQLALQGPETIAHELIEDLGAPGRRELRRLAASSPTARKTLAVLPAVPDVAVEIAVLGPLEIRRNGQEVVDAGLRRQRVRDMLCYLVVHPRTTRAQLAASLWPDLDDQAAAENLRVNLTHLVKVLEPQRSPGEASYLLRQEGAALTLRVGDWLSVDAHEFQAAVDRAGSADAAGTMTSAFESYEAAIALYRGSYLEDAGDVEWAGWERERVRGVFVRIAVRSGELLLGLGRPEDAVDRAWRAIGADRWCEPAHQLLVRAHTAMGDRLAAAHALAGYRQVLADLGLRGGDELTALERLMR
jgi:DNA-binding SARP family transcriptional activator